MGKPSPYTEGLDLLPPPVNPELGPAPETETSSVIAAQIAVPDESHRPNTIKVFTSKIISATKDNSAAKILCAKHACSTYTYSDAGLEYCNGDNGSGNVDWDFFKIENTNSYYIRNTKFLGRDCAYNYLRT